ncbi:MAG: tRNA uridine-5-carboxymethylaminomethyl(34) synthesis GTPase MnmE [Nitrospirae bacterium]|nr:tRNA uridine-5-carboxymethylaminomethyl(34) synthesis GTPase MnmE [Nitrospirota bacterium]MBI5695119.1 tRNA uridine-5-carboxymethylaminomethyl(34) synthesis GTPase MnmE [Nitrospirota bacterium]
MKDNTNDTICAISTPPGMGGIGIVRVSGPDAVGVACRLMPDIASKVGGNSQSHYIIYGHVVNQSDGRVLDEALLTVMRAPRTYTREDVAEINCHGGPAAVRAVLSAAMAAGARLAEPGEFTRRAYLNGRIDLTQAEAVMDLIASRTELSLAAAAGQLGGGLRGRVEGLRERIAGLLALVELSIDFSEEDVEVAPAAALLEKSAGIRADLDGLIASYGQGRVLREGLRVAIVGRPNVGKSSLLNLLARDDRAIVTDVPGTTRDTVEETINIGGLPVVVIDTAGIRHSEDVVEKEGIRRSVKALENSDLALLVLDGATELTAEDTALIDKIRGRACVPVINKSDLPGLLDDGQLRELLGDAVPVHICAKSGEGLDALVARIRESALGGGMERPPDVAINLRHKDALSRAASALGSFDAGVAGGHSPELLALELRDALDAVGDVVGATTPDDVLNRIFGEFCIGK